MKGSEDKCRVCGLHLGYGLEMFHLGICEDCDDEEEAQKNELDGGAQIPFAAFSNDQFENSTDPVIVRIREKLQKLRHEAESGPGAPLRESVGLDPGKMPMPAVRPLEAQNGNGTPSPGGST